MEDIKENFRTIARRMRMNIEIEKLYKDVNIANFIKLQRDIRNGWMMRENTKKIRQANVQQNRRQGRPKTRWKFEGVVSPLCF